ncbi:MAG: glycosyltransferase family 4 protein [Halanaerobiaceae bacterium]
MKIAIFTDTFSPQINGVTKNLDRLVEYFENNNIDYIVIAPEVDGVNIDVKENKVVRMNSFNFFLYPELKFSIPNYFKFKKELIDFQPDLIHLVTPFNIGLSGLYYAKRNDIPFVASYHTNFDQYLDYYNINFLKDTAWKYLKWFHNQALCNYCPSKVTLSELYQKGFKNLDIWGRGINTELFSPEYRSYKLRKEYNLQGKIVILYVGRLAKEKNLLLLKQSFLKLNEKYRDRIALVITGDGPESKEFKNSNCKNIVFTGYKTGYELSEIYASADIFAFPSVTETYGNVIIEAMASGLPVVAVMKGGIKENLLDGYNGIACYQNDVGEFTECLEKIIVDSDLRRELAKRARRHSLSKTWDEVFEKLINSYQNVLENYSFSEIISA